MALSDRNLGILNFLRKIQKISFPREAWLFWSVWLARSGNVNSSILYNAGNSGNGWSSTVSTSTDAYNLGFTSGVVNPQNVNTNNRMNGFPVRCLAR